MARRVSLGFSLVEMLVALVFTTILMAGMATVFKASITGFYTSGEKLSSMRRNRSSLDLLYDDLNTAGMALVDITSALTASEAYPAFYVIPNVAIAAAGSDDPQMADELYMAYDQPLAFDGKLTKGGGAVSGATAVDKVLDGTAATSGTDNKYEIDCGDPTYASAVHDGMFLHIKDDMSHAALKITGTPTVSGNKVTITTLTDPSLETQVTGRGDPGSLRPNKRIASSGVVFILPAQMVRYRIAMLKLDPTKANGIPCLIREQGVYDANAAFAADGSLTQIIAENVANFKVYLSADSGTSWAGSALPATTTGFASGWTSGIQAALNTQLGTVARQDYTTTAGNLSWYRDIPTLVRMDVTTRTATQRAEYSSTPTSLAYKNLTQSLVLVPRHFGLPLN